MKKWNLVFDAALCTGCRNCEVAVRDEYTGNRFPGYSEPMPAHSPGWLRIRTRERGEFPAVDVSHLVHCCQHCDQPACRAVAKNGAVEKRADGIVIIHPDKAKGQKAIADACPFGAVVWNEALQIPQHWNFDAHLIDAGWPAPRPVQACPTGALRALKVEDKDMRRIAREEQLAPFGPGGETASRVHYRNLHRYTHAFLAGTLLAERDGTEDCVAGAAVRLSDGDRPLAETTSDVFGDFRIDGLAPHGRLLHLTVSAEGWREHALDVQMSASRWLGEIRLQKT